MPVASASEIDAAYHELQAATVDSTRRAIALAWLASFDVDRIDASALALGPVFEEVISRGQASAVSTALAYFSAFLRVGGAREDPSFQVNPGAFLGIATDGFGVGPGAATLAALASKGSIARGVLPAVAEEVALRRVLTFATTEVQDTGRAVVEMSGLLDERVVGFERVVNLPACGRCIVLSGKRYAKSADFDRHEGDDCGQRPYTDYDPPFAEEDSNPNRLLDAMTPAQRVKALGVANAEAYDAGADAATLINARSGMRAAGDTFTVQGVTKRSLFASRNRAAGLVKPGPGRQLVSARARLSPAGVRAAAGGDPVKYRRLLRSQGYLLDG